MAAKQRGRRRRPTRGADLLLEFLERHSLSYETAGNALGVSHVAVYQWAVGMKRPTPDNRKLIATWTNGEVPAEAWTRPDEVQRRVEPFRPTGTDG